MQLEIKIIIDLGEDTNAIPAFETNVRDTIYREKENGAFTNGLDVEIESMLVLTGWTSSGDDEE